MGYLAYVAEVLGWYRELYRRREVVGRPLTAAELLQAKDVAADARLTKGE
ncbi:Uncharacterised protein [Mycobacteroides abscessus subsp. massiliense]|nr:Uncharacterised protein [Mycobacteroides abscessus subsp. abscessus]SKM67068.1 Uncharacterised protein [Mycobacteroides abscessus subsp. massiliense]SHX44148.1 Uncharacterised protein [Mycobacteroides abscessus subsp. abscessus]SIA41317.1 Uncharacterised protein [Mycobacteroides abscessus subsp. abscessus]SIM49174.1 Uncharacterised protein [Mycobacteroides abscessus subsp. abscessus]